MLAWLVFTFRTEAKGVLRHARSSIPCTAHAAASSHQAVDKPAHFMCLFLSLHAYTNTEEHTNRDPRHTQNLHLLAIYDPIHLFIMFPRNINRSLLRLNISFVSIAFFLGPKTDQ